MVTFEKFYKNFKDIDKFIINLSKELLMKREKTIVALSNEQLMEGKNVHDKLMQKGYSTGYTKLRKKKGLQTRYVDLKFTGKYQKSKKLYEAKDGVDIRSAADYEAHLRGNYPDHVGLNKKNAEVVAKSISDELAKRLKKYLVT